MALTILLTGLTPTAQGQTYSVIYTFTGGPDGAYPSTGLTMDAAGHLYGTAFSGGTAGMGTVFFLSNNGGAWTFQPLHSFSGGPDGAGPLAQLVIGPDGALYGSTTAGGGGPCMGSNGYLGCGTVYKLRPPMSAPASAIHNWSTTVLYSFSGNDGQYPQGELTFDQTGNIYGTTVTGGSSNWGEIYRLTPSSGGWTENTLYSAQGNGDGKFPWGGVVFDSAGNLYGGFTENGPYGYGALFELKPSGSGWRESTIHGFRFIEDDGAIPQGGLTRDSAGNLYGTTAHSLNGGGTVFKLVPSGGAWSYNFLYGLSGGIDVGPYGKLLMDAAGNLYGTTMGDGQYGYGSVFKLTPSSGGWIYTSLHDFTGGSDGGDPICTLVMDSSGNLYGTASLGGAGFGVNGWGVVFRITP
ncbi:MAG TPA: choice-of-anchor tandem repeat GloVer-containing protein [Terriglobales bacterium]|nr:choice-of-anchor tandem repeat GloVer-containing protein [Terriglobales bacterium]